MTGAQRAVLMRDLITRRGRSIVLQTDQETLLTRYADASVQWTNDAGAIVSAGAPGAALRVVAKATRLEEKDLASVLQDTAIEGPPIQFAGWEVTDTEYPLYEGQEKFVHRGVLYTILRIKEIEDGDTLIKAIVITDYAA